MGYNDQVDDDSYPLGTADRLGLDDIDYYHAAVGNQPEDTPSDDPRREELRLAEQREKRDRIAATGKFRSALRDAYWVAFDHFPEHRRNPLLIVEIAKGILSVQDR